MSRFCLTRRAVAEQGAGPLGPDRHLPRSQLATQRWWRLRQARIDSELSTRCLRCGHRIVTEFIDLTAKGGEHDDEEVNLLLMCFRIRISVSHPYLFFTLAAAHLAGCVAWILVN